MVTIWYAIFNQYINMDARWNNARCPISAFETCLAIFSLWVWAGSWRVRPSSGRARSYARLCGRGSGAPGSRQRHLAVDEATTPARSYLTYRSHLPPSFLFRDLSRRNVSYCQKKEKEKEKEKEKRKKKPQNRDEPLVEWKMKLSTIDSVHYWLVLLFFCCEMISLNVG